MNQKVVVVGGGLGGLAAATLLAKAGARVVVVERRSAPGGRATSDEIGGFVLDQGPHALYVGGPADETLRSLGVPIEGRAPSSAGSFALMQGRAWELPTSIGALARCSFLSIRGKLELSLLLARRAPAGTTVREHVEARVASVEGRALAFALIRLVTYTNAPGELDARFAFDLLEKVGRSGVLYLDGGWQSLVRGLVERAREAGVELRHGSPEVRVEADRVRGIVLEGELLAADHVVLATGPRAARTLVPTEPTLAAPRRPVRAAVLQVALARLPRPERRFAIGVDGPFYYSVPSLTAKVAPEGLHAVNVAKYLPVDGDEPTSEAELSGFLDALQPGFAPHVLHRRFLPALVVAHAVPGTGAATPATRGLHFVGDWVSPRHHLLDAVMASAHAVVARIASGRENVAAA
jgi:phytoene dehydrogenase-like protein